MSAPTVVNVNCVKFHKTMPSPKNQLCLCRCQFSKQIWTSTPNAHSNHEFRSSKCKCLVCKQDSFLSFDWKAQRQKPKILSFLSTTRKDIHSSSKIFENYRLNANAKIPLTENVEKWQSSCMAKDNQ